MNLAGPAVLFLVAAIPALTVVAVAMDQNSSETRREIVDISAYPWASIGKIWNLRHLRPQHLHGFRDPDHLNKSSPLRTVST